MADLRAHRKTVGCATFPPAPTQLALFLRAVLSNAVRRIGNDRVDRIRGLRRQPAHAIGGI